MGPVVTINSATMVNKGLEVIEAHELFDVPYDDIEVMVHPQSVLHSLVEFADGSTLAQASPPDMRLPIALALAWPDRVPGAAAAVDWTLAHNWELRPLDDEAFPAVRLAKAAGTGRALPAGDLQRGERGVCGRVRVRSATFSGHRRHPRGGARGGARFRRAGYRRGGARRGGLGACPGPADDRYGG